MYSKDGTATVEYNVLPSSFIAGRKRDLHPLIIKVREAEPDSLGSASQFLCVFYRCPLDIRQMLFVNHGDRRVIVFVKPSAVQIVACFARYQRSEREYSDYIRQ